MKRWIQPNPPSASKGWQSRAEILREHLASLSPLELLRVRPDLYAQTWGWDFENKRYASGRLALYEELEEKAGFRWWQLRWPKGSGEDSGRWRYEGGSNRQTPPGVRPSRTPRPAGHHFVPRKVFEAKDLKLSAEAREVFANRTTGPLRGQVHGNSREHENYTRAVRELMDKYLLDNGIRPEAMTTDQAKKFADMVRQSREPRIYNFNYAIFRREVSYHLRRVSRVD